MKLRVNILCLVGAFVGLIAIMLPWNSVWFFSVNLIDLINIGSGYFGQTSPEAGILVIGSIIFIIGTLVAFLTPTGGIVQIAGLGILFYLFSGADSHFPNGIGFYLACVSPIMILLGLVGSKMMTVSLTEPMSIGYDNRPPNMRDRLLTFNTTTNARKLQYPQPMPQQQAYYPQQPAPQQQIPMNAQTNPMPNEPNLSLNQEMGMVMHCPECGKRLEGGTFCKHCGAKIG